MCGAVAHVCFGPKADIAPFYSITSSARTSSEGGTAKSERAIVRSIAKEDFRDSMRTDARAGNARMTTWFRRRCDGSAIGQDTDRSPGIEKTNDVVAVGEEAAPMRDKAQTSTAQGEELLALGSAQVRKDVREPAEAIVDECAVVGCAGGKG